MTELELKLALPPEQVARLQGLPLFSRHHAGPVCVQLMRAHYYDTPDGLLARHRMALRLRHEGAGWVQTFKTASGESLAVSRRGEWEQAVPGPSLDWPALLATPLAQLPDIGMLPQRLRRVFSMRFERRSWPLAWRNGAQAVLSLDQGEISVGAGAQRRSVPICELEIEHRAGDAAVLWKFAQQLAREVALVPLAASKAERGWVLRRGPAGPKSTHLPPLDAHLPVVNAFALEMVGPLAALQHNLQHAMLDAPDYVHQARVALRRLRSVLRAFGPLPEARGLRRRVRALREPLRRLGHVLGAARDADVFATDTLGLLRTRFELSTDTVAARLEQRRAQAYAAIAALWQQSAHGQALLLAERLAWDIAALSPSAQDRPLPEVAAEVMERAHQRVMKVARGLMHQEAQARHRLRIEVKRLRYLADLWAGLWPGKRMHRYLQTLERLQVVLGTLNDAAVAGQMLRELGADEALQAAWQAHEQHLLSQTLPRVRSRLSTLGDCAAPWRSGG